MGSVALKLVGGQDRGRVGPSKESPAPLDRLRHHLRSLAVGPVEDIPALMTVLGPAWDSLYGTDPARCQMSRDKLWRMEQVTWEPFNLCFTIERHGAAKFGSIKAELQRWTVNPDYGTVMGGDCGYRLLYPRAKRLKVEPLAEQVVALIKDRQPHPWVTWLPRDRVRVEITVVIPHTVNETTMKRRRRFRAALDPRLEAMGYEPVPAWNTYVRCADRAATA